MKGSDRKVRPFASLTVKFLVIKTASIFEAVPKTSHVAVLWNPIVTQSHVSYGDFNELKETETAARILGVQLLSVEARSASDLEQAFSRMTAARADALVVLTDGMFNANRSRIVQLAAKNRIPAIYAEEEYILAGGLMLYAPSTEDLGRRTATYVDKIVKGTKPADLPVERPTKFGMSSGYVSCAGHGNRLRRCRQWFS